MAFSFGATLRLNDGDFRSRVRSAISNTRQLGNSLQSATGQMRNMNRETQNTSLTTGSLVKSLGGLAAGFLTVQGAVSVFKSALGGASELESYRGTLNAVMKDQKKAGETMAWSVKFANSTPFETDSVVKATVRLQAYGMKAQDVMTDIGNMAGIMNTDLMQAVEAVADSQTGSLERLKEFGITKQMIVDQGHKIMGKKELVNSKGQITNQKAFNQTLFSLMRSRFKGGMDLQSKSMKGVWSTVTGVAKTSLATLMGVTATGEIKVGGLFDKIKQKVVILGNTLTKWSQDGTIERASQKITNAINGVGKAIDWTKQNANWLIPVLGGVVATFAAFSILNTVKGWMVAYRAVTQGMTLAQWALNVAMNANPLGLVALAIGVLIGAGIALYKNWDTVKVKLGEFWNYLKETWQKIRELLKNPLKGFVNLFQKNSENGGGSKVDGSHYSGLARVPKDGYIAELHKGEAVIPAKDNPYNNNNTISNSNQKNNVVININGTDKSTRQIMNELIPELQSALGNI